ncbi:MAG: hypothetical protein U9R19_00230 [Bacteroidota bacterium]|nr:hypothetical protein [Bacteroidota bacterium]
MKRILFLILSLAILKITVFGQCFDFAKEVTKNQLPPYIHDGNYNTTLLTEGQEAEFFKTFYAGQKYRIIIISDKNINQPKFEIMDKSRKVIYSNLKNGNSQSWDFTLDESQQLIISIKVPNNKDNIATPQRGCVSIIFGFLNQS